MFGLEQRPNPAGAQVIGAARSGRYRTSRRRAAILGLGVDPLFGGAIIAKPASRR